MKMDYKVTLMVSIRVVGSGEQGAVMERSYYTGDASRENARQAILRLKRMGLCTGEVYKVIKSALGDFYVGVF